MMSLPNPASMVAAAPSAWTFTVSAWSPVSIVTTPDVPRERVELLRKAFVTMLKDEAFAADARKINFDIDAMAGAELQAYFATASYPADLLARAKEIAKSAGY